MRPNLNIRPISFVIFAAGKGKRFWPITKKIPKVILKIKEKPLIGYVLDTAKKMGAKEVFIVIEYKKEMIKKKIGNKYHGLPIKYIIQKGSEGLVHNIAKVGEVINSDFVLLLGDEIYLNTKHKKIIPFYLKEKPDGVCGISKGASPELIKKGYSVEVRGKFISKVAEKPEKTVNDLRGWGTYVFDRSVFDFIKKTPINSKTGKKELADLIQTMINAGKKFLPFNLEGFLVNVNTKEDLTEARKLMKKKNENGKN